MLPDEFEIREMLTGDIEAVMGIEREVFTFPWTPEFFECELRRGEITMYLVAFAGGRLLGFTGAHLLGDEIHVTNMAVAPDVRRRGLGSALLMECVHLGLKKGARWLTLEVRETNRDAREFYRFFGFRELGMRRGYYCDTGEDAVIMVAGDIREGLFRELPARWDKSAAGGEGEG